MAHRSKARPHAAGSGYESPPAGTSQRYGLTHFHPGQIRNAYPKHNQAEVRAFSGNFPITHCAAVRKLQLSGRS
jgi:hypothetical protein